jgi:hypothetical protein
MRTPGTRSARRLGGAAAAVLALALAPPATATNGPVRLNFTKDCPMLTCTGSLVSPAGKRIPGSSVSSELAPIWAFGAPDTLHYSGIETISSRAGSFKMRLLGILDYTADPDLTYLIGTVETGSWRGRDLTGASITVVARRAFATTFRGVIHVRPAR